MTETYLHAPCEIYLALPSRAMEGNPWVLACHGSGREARSYRDVPFYRKQRDLTLEAGCAFACVSNGSDTWGTERGLQRLGLTYAYLIEAYGLAARYGLWGSSAGGAAMFRFAQQYPQRAALLLGIFPVWDLRAQTDLPSYQQAFRHEAPVNPADSPQLLADVPVVIAQGLRDECVPAHRNALRVKEALGERVQLHLTRDGHSTDAWALYSTPLFLQALRAYGRGVK